MAVSCRLFWGLYFAHSRSESLPDFPSLAPPQLRLLGIVAIVEGSDASKELMDLAKRREMACGVFYP
jgi:hypothetical protein